MTPEQIKDAHLLLRILDDVNGQIAGLDKVMQVGDASCTIQMNSGKSTTVHLTTCDKNKEGVSIANAVRSIFAYKRDNVISQLKKLGVTV